MQEFLERLVAALMGAGIRAMPALPAKLMAHWKAPMTAVGVEAVEQVPAALGQYLGLREDLQRGEEDVYGRFLEATVFFQVASPVVLGGGRCFQEAMRLLDFLLAGVEGTEILACTAERCKYDAKADCFTCTVTAKLRGAVYLQPTGAPAQAVTDFDLRGEIG